MCALTLEGVGFIPAFRIDPRTDQRVAVMDGFSGRIVKGLGLGALEPFRLARP